MGGIFILLASAFPFDYGTSFAQGLNQVTEENASLDAKKTSVATNVSTINTNTSGNVSNNYTGHGKLIATINASALPKSAPYSGPHILESENETDQSPDLFHPSNVTKNETRPFQLPYPFHPLNSSSLKQPVNQTTNNFTDPIDQPNSQCYCVPPDVQVAVGHRVPETRYQYAIEMTNLALQMFGYEFNCNPCSNFATQTKALGPFFGLDPSNTDYLTDPRVIYDAINHRFFAAVIDGTNDTMLVAVSASANPLGTWHTFGFKFNACPDNPSIGTSSSIFAISGNLYPSCMPNSTGAFMGVQLKLIEKNDLLTGSMNPRFKDITPKSLNPPDPPNPPTLKSLRIVKDTFEPLKAVVMEQYKGNGNTYAIIFTYSNARGGCVDNEACYQDTCGPSPNGEFLPTNMCTVEIHTPIPTANADQPGTTFQLATGDNRIQSASAGGNPLVLRDRDTGGSLWFAYNEGCGDTEKNSCFRLVKFREQSGPIGVGSHQVNKTIYKLQQDFPVTLAPNDVFYPALEVDRDKNMGLIFGFSGSSIFPSLAVSRQDFLGTPPLQPPATAVSGTVSETNKTNNCGSSTMCRYGDYFGASANPNERNWWLAGEWMTTDSSSNPIWSTYIVPFFVRP
jgi:hypothetical protein